MKLDERYYCFGCGATGDAVDLTAKLFGLSPHEAARKLAYDFGLPPARPSVMTMLKAPIPDKTEERRCFHALSGYSRLLRQWKDELAPATPDEPLDERFIAACHDEGYIVYLSDIFITGTAEEQKDAAHALLGSGLIAKIENIMEEHHGRNKKQRGLDRAI